MPPKKRQAKGKQAAAPPPPAKQAKQEGQKAVRRDINVPIDEGFQEDPRCKVHLDDEGIIFDASLNQTNIGGNNNKFYRLQLLENHKGTSFYTHTRWGRVGEFGQVKTMGPFDFDAALKEFDKKFKDKSGHKWEDRDEPPKKGKYTYIVRDYEDDDDKEDEKPVKVEHDDGTPEIKSELPVQTQRLVELIFNQNHFNSVLEGIGYNADKLPLGKLSKATLKQGFDYLNELASLIKHPSLAQNKHGVSQREAINDYSNKYYSTIPHDFGRNRPPPISNQDTLRAEISMLDTLTDMEVANTIMKTTSDKSKDQEAVNMLDKRFRELNLSEVTCLDHKSEEYKLLADYLIKSSGDSHYIRYRLEDIFRIEREGEADRFNTSSFAKVKKTDKRLLWHGSRVTNYGGILSQGLRIAPPEAPATGYAFGKGIYMADISSKSAQYCSSGMSGGTGLLLLVEAELGKPMYEIPSGDSNAEQEARKRGYSSTLGVGRTCPQGWIDGSAIHESLKGVKFPDVKAGIGQNKAAPAGGYLMYNEYIAYDVKQLKLRYLFRIGM